MGLSQVKSFAKSKVQMLIPHSSSYQGRERGEDRLQVTMQGQASSLYRDTLTVMLAQIEIVWDSYITSNNIHPLCKSKISRLLPQMVRMLPRR